MGSRASKPNIIKSKDSKNKVIKVSPEGRSQSIQLQPLKYGEESFQKKEEFIEPAAIEKIAEPTSVIETPPPAKPNPSKPTTIQLPNAAAQIAEQKAKIEQEINELKNTKLQEMNQELEAIKSDADTKGYEEGKARIENELSEAMTDTLAQLNALSELKKEDLYKQEELVVKLALEMAKKIIQQELSDKPEIFTSLFQEAFDKITDKDHVVVTLHPSNLAQFESYKAAFKEKFKDIQRLELIEDESIQPGGCSIETKLGYIDAKIQSKCDLLEKAILSFQDGEIQRIEKEKEQPEVLAEEAMADVPHHNETEAPLLEPEPDPEPIEDSFEAVEEDEDAYQESLFDTADDDDDDDDYSFDDDDDDDFDDDDYEDDFDFEDYDDDFD